jgi:hypothetical protein
MGVGVGVGVGLGAVGVTDVFELLLQAQANHIGTTSSRSHALVITGSYRTFNHIRAGAARAKTCSDVS